MLLERQACVPTALGEPTKLNSEASQNFPVEDSLPQAMLTPRESYERSLAASYKRISQELLGQIPASSPAAEQRTKKLEKKPFDVLKGKIREKPLLRKEQLQSKVLEDLHIFVITDSHQLISSLHRLNRTHTKLAKLRAEAQKDPNHKYLSIDEEGFLLYKGCLIVPDAENIRTELIREVHDQLSTAHPGITKTYQLLRARYYWSGMREWVERFVRNCQKCRRSEVWRDKTPGLHHALEAPHCQVRRQCFRTG